jgi:hypothetical protein
MVDVLHAGKPHRVFRVQLHLFSSDADCLCGWLFVRVSGLLLHVFRSFFFLVTRPYSTQVPGKVK